MEIMEGNIKYKVEWDIDDLERMRSGENCHLNEEYRQAFFKLGLSTFFVARYEKCECCDNWKYIDGLGAIHEDDEESALKHYKEHEELYAYMDALIADIK